MQVALPSSGLDAYTSKAQRARIATEAWASTNLYCPGFRLDRGKCHPNSALCVSALRDREEEPLAETARRAEWVGCNILLHSIPPDARIKIITDGRPVAPAAVRAQYARIRPLAELDGKQRGWTLDVLNAVRSLGKTEFDLAELYKSEGKLAKLHPANRHVREKIRQQLQVLRDLGLLEFLGDGEYRLR